MEQREKMKLTKIALFLHFWFLLLAGPTFVLAQDLNKTSILFGGGFSNSYVEVAANENLIFSGYLTTQTGTTFAAMIVLSSETSMAIDIVDSSINSSVKLEIKRDSEPFILVERSRQKNGKLALAFTKHQARPRTD